MGMRLGGRNKVMAERKSTKIRGTRWREKNIRQLDAIATKADDEDETMLGLTLLFGLPYWLRVRTLYHCPETLYTCFK